MRRVLGALTRFSNAGLDFDVTDTGPRDGPVVILLHGFPQDRTSWAAVAARLAEQGHRVLAPDQRGYSPGARPPRRRDYVLDLLAGDVLALADRAGATTFDLAGHDWGAALAFHVAGHHPDRVRTLTAFSVPHPAAWLPSVLRSSQLWHSGYMGFFQLPRLPEWLLSRGHGATLRSWLTRSGLPEDFSRVYGRRAADPQLLRAPLNWYRMLPFALRTSSPVVAVSTVFVWSTADRYITRHLAESCRRWVSGPYTFVELPGVPHWIPEREPDTTAGLIHRHATGSGAIR